MKDIFYTKKDNFSSQQLNKDEFQVRQNEVKGLISFSVVNQKVKMHSSARTWQSFQYQTHLSDKHLLHQLLQNPPVQTYRWNTPRICDADVCSQCKGWAAFPRRKRTNAWNEKKETFKNNPTVKWKITLAALQINCRIKVLMGNKESKNSYSSLWNRIKLTHFTTRPPLSYCSVGFWWQLHRQCCHTWNWWEQEHLVFFPKDGADPCFNSMSKR